jgi:peroxiredoxin
MPAYEREGVAVFAISYDPVETLARFAEERRITFALLSDAGSRTIERLGLLNRHVAEQQAYYDMPVQERHEGIPYPGAFLLDPEGRVVEKVFEQSYRVRPSGSLLLQDLTGLDAEPVVSARAKAWSVQVAAWLDTATYRPYQRLRVHAAVRVEPGLHVYGVPVPEGYVPLRIELAPFEGLIAEPATLPAPQPFRMEGLDERFVVYEGTVRAAIPFRIEPMLDEAILRVLVRYQSCSASVCNPPAQHELPLRLTGIDALRD